MKEERSCITFWEILNKHQDKVPDILRKWFDLDPRLNYGLNAWIEYYLDQFKMYSWNYFKNVLFKNQLATEKNSIPDLEGFYIIYPDPKEMKDQIQEWFSQL